jgi:ABC-type bacteriocin/lantibiotic exporter with double-glycine peptidase domain
MFKNIFGLKLNKSETLKLYIIFFLSLSNALLDLIGITTLLPIILNIINPDQLIEFLNNKYLMFYFKNLSADYLIKIAFLLFLIIISLKLIFQIFYSFLSANFTAELNTKISYKIFFYYIFSDYESLAIRKEKSEIFRNLGLASELTNNLFNIINFFQNIILIAIFVFTLLIVNYQITFLSLFIVLSFFTIFYLMLKKKIVRYGNETYAINKTSISKIFSAFDSIKTTKISNNEQFFLNEFHKTQIILNYINRNKIFLQSLPRALIDGLIMFGIFIALYFAYYEKNNDNITSIMFIGLGCTRLIPNCYAILTTMINFAFIKKLKKEVTQILILLDNQNDIIPSSNKEKSNDLGIIELKNISYKYPNSIKNVVENLNLKIDLGKFIGISGANGSGKTTTVDLILGLLKPSKGEILVNNYKSDRIHAEFKGIKYVEQTPYVSNNTVRENIAYAIPEDIIDDERVKYCLEIANLNDRIKKFPNGIYHKLINSGVELSGGEKQKLTIARAVYDQPKLLILDEITSSLDEESSKIILQNLKYISKKSKISIIMISHNKKDYEYCDEIINLNVT